MSKFVKAFAALALTASIGLTDAHADDHEELNIETVGDEAADAAFGKADALNTKLLDGQKTLDAIKAKVADAADDATVLKGAETDLTALAADLKSVPDDIKAIIDEAKGIKLSGNFITKAKKGKAVISNVAQLDKVTKNADALIEAVSATTTEVAESAKAAAEKAAEAAGEDTGQ
ncbi:MAG: hypothetical protein VX944_02425 [Myxococcota bacterium]|jgi:hypothetical protein|nr:hypothetical protein [Myxococcota bacterium]MEC9388904.1 hypothetical protein [Myxococcota bacterium]